MLKGIHLTLMIGPAVPVPVPRAVLEALTSVEVKTTAGHRSPSGFELTFKLSNQSPLHTLFLLTGGSMPPIMRVIIIVTINGTPEVLIDGVITQQKVSPGNASGNATLTVTGLDLTAVMNWIDFSGFPFPAMPAEARIVLILAKYAMFGIIPKVIPSILIDVPIPVQRIPRQQGKDLDYINHLADEVGYVFYLEPGPAPGISTAYWGPEIKVGAPQPALNMNMDAHTNVETLDFTFNNDTKTIPVLLIQNLESKVLIPIPVPDITPLNPPLGAIPPLSLKFEMITGTGKLNPLQAAVIGLTKAARSSEAVKATGSLDVRRYGRILKARKLVGVRGAGTAFDGLYYVTSVTHKIKPNGEYKQSFTLSRNGLVSTLDKVPV
jgi:hypothetical protein